MRWTLTGLIMLLTLLVTASSDVNRPDLFIYYSADLYGAVEPCG
jgi:hypothetical protein